MTNGLGLFVHWSVRQKLNRVYVALIVRYALSDDMKLIALK